MGALVVGMPELAPAAKGDDGSCHPQLPQRFLERKSYVRGGVLDAVAHRRAVAYRVEKYGNVEGSGVTGGDGSMAASHAKGTTFFGHPLSVHERIVPALRCAERKLETTCTGKVSRYEPRQVGGFRFANTIRGGEISNHLFGIAVDLDPEENPCCHCVDKWKTNPRCKLQGSAYERAKVTRCWVKTFEHYGFYWLGDDTLEDTMHFEFLGRPERIRR